MKKYLSDYIILGVFSGLIVAFDQWTKWLVRSTLAIQETWAPWDWILPYARIVHWKNTGVAFGMFQNLGDVIMVLSTVVSVAIIFYFPRVPRQDVFLRIALIMQLGGAVGNLVDRILRGYVTDFISLGTFAVFNVADSSISIGVVVLLVGVWIQEWQKKSKNPATIADSTQESSAKLPEDLE